MHGLNVRCGLQNAECGRKWTNVEMNMNHGHQHHCSGMRKQVQKEIVIIVSMVLRFKGLKDATSMGWFGNDWDCLVGCPPEAMIT